MWKVFLFVIAAGAIGGFINALTTDNGFPMPRTEVIGGITIWRPGLVGNILTGMVAAFVSWALYGPLSNFDLMASQDTQAAPTMTLSTLAGVVLIGVGGARWLTGEVDKRIFKGGMIDMAKDMSANMQEEEFMKAPAMEAVKMASGQS